MRAEAIALEQTVEVPFAEEQDARGAGLADAGRAPGLLGAVPAAREDTGARAPHLWGAQRIACSRRASYRTSPPSPPRVETLPRIDRATSGDGGATDPALIEKLRRLGTWNREALLGWLSFARLRVY